jgi:hypothetical protein
VQLLKRCGSSGIKCNCDSSTAFSNWPKKCEVKGGWRRLHNEEFYDLCSLPNTIRVIKSKSMRWVRCIAYVGETRSA